MYPHSVTAVLSTRERSVIRRNAALLPAYSFLLGLLALLGFVAIAAGVKVTNPQQAVPQLFENEFPDWFAGVAFAAIVIGALVPAAIMSIAAANLWTRNVYKAFINRDATHAQEAQQSQGRLAAGEVRRAGCSCCSCSTTYALDLQLLGGVWILQTFPAIVVGLYTRLVPPLGADRRLGGRHGLRHRGRLQNPKVGDPGSHFGSPLNEFPFTETLVYIGFTAMLINLLVTSWPVRSSSGR